MIQIGTADISLDDVANFLKHPQAVSLHPDAVTRMSSSHLYVQDVLKNSSKPIYGVNTGFGSLKNIKIPIEDLETLQLNLIRSHAVGVGSPLDSSYVKLMMFLRAQTLSKGYSGVSVEVVQRLVDMLREDIVPVIPSQGSVGASGDLAPLSHLALCVVGEGQVNWKGALQLSSTVFKILNWHPIKLKPKEALALVNGTQMMTAVGSANWIKASCIARACHVACALSLEASLGTSAAYEPKVHALKPHKGQIKVANQLHLLLKGSEFGQSHLECDKVQDAYSIRCAPQVHGVAEQALEFVKEILETEMNSVTDNPIVFSKEGQFVSAGHFHGQMVSFAMDALSIALTSLGAISERRTFRLLSPTLSDLPATLIKNPGLQSGLMMLQVTSAALVSENKVLSHPASVDSIPTWMEQEDHVSMGAHAAMKNGQIVNNLAHIVAIELICAVHGIHCRRPLKSSKALESIISWVEGIVPLVSQDRSLSSDISRLADLIAFGEMDRYLDDLPS